MFDHFLNDRSNYIENKLNLDILKRGIAVLKLIFDAQLNQITATVKADQEIRQPTETQNLSVESNSSQDIEHLTKELAKQGYCFRKTKHRYSELIRLVDQNNKQAENELLDIVNLRNCYGAGLSRTEFGKTCIVENLFSDPFIELEMLSLFGKCGRVLNIRVLCDEITGEQSGRAYLTFTTRHSAKEAIRQVNPV